MPASERTLLRFVNGRPISPLTCAFLAWAAEQLAAEGVRVLALIWDNAGVPQRPGARGGGVRCAVARKCRAPRAPARGGWGLLAHQPRGAGLGQEAQSRGQADRPRLPPSDLPAAEPKSVAQPDRAQMGPRQ